MRVLEFYCGIGGFSAAIPNNWEVVGAIDQNQLALEVYRNNFPHRTFAWNIVGLSAERLAPLAADFWWMSPPCKPFTLRGPRADVDDPRCESFLHLLTLLAQVRPSGIALVVPGLGLLVLLVALFVSLFPWSPWRGGLDATTGER